MIVFERITCNLSIYLSIYLSIANTMLVSFDIKLSGETRNSVGMARLAEPF